MRRRLHYRFQARTLPSLGSIANERTGDRKLKMTPSLINKAQRMYNARQFTMAEIAQSCGVTPMTIYRHITTGDDGAHHS